MAKSLEVIITSKLGIIFFMLILMGFITGCDISKTSRLVACSSDSDCQNKYCCIDGYCQTNVCQTDTDLESETDFTKDTPEEEGNNLCLDSDGDNYHGSGQSCDPDDNNFDCDDTDEAINPGADEICDSKDNDCDGSVDEEYPDLNKECNTERLGSCLSGTNLCINEQLHCIGSNPEPEICDGIDNDCNGTTDDGLRDCCSAPEVCDGHDNDCDGSIDEDLDDIPCDTGNFGMCSMGVLRCIGGVSLCTTEYSPRMEECNEQDDDCDGQVDELVPGCCVGQEEIESCGIGRGECNQGIKRCEVAFSWSDCRDAFDNPVTRPTEEVCDGLDNDCDGKIDEDLSDCFLEIDNDDNGFSLSPENDWWYIVSYEGFNTNAVGDNLRYTFGTVEEETHRGIWQSTEPLSDGQYEVFAYQPNPDPFSPAPELGIFSFSRCNQIKYVVYYGDGESSETVTATQTGMGWFSLGTYNFSNTVGKIYLGNVATPEGCVVILDAVKWLRR